MANELTTRYVQSVVVSPLIEGEDDQDFQLLSCQHVHYLGRADFELEVGEQVSCYNCTAEQGNSMTIQQTASGRGGTRPGSGRKPITDPDERRRTIKNRIITICVTEETADYIRSWGSSPTAAIGNIIERAQKFWPKGE